MLKTPRLVYVQTIIPDTYYEFQRLNLTIAVQVLYLHKLNLAAVLHRFIKRVQRLC